MCTGSGKVNSKLSFAVKVTLEERQLAEVIIVSTKSSTILYTLTVK